MGFLNDHIATLVRLATSKAAIDTTNPVDYHNLLEDMARCREPALPGQTLAVAGAFLSCLKYRGVIISGEMGVGKTNIAAYLARMVQTFLVQDHDPGCILQDPSAARAAQTHRRVLKRRGAKVLFLLARSGHEEKMMETFKRVLGDVETVMLDNTEKSFYRALDNPPPGKIRVYFASRDTIKGAFPKRLLDRCPACLHNPYEAWEKANSHTRKLPPNFDRCPRCGTSMEAPSAKILCTATPVFTKAAPSRGGMRKVPLLRRIRKRLDGKKCFDLAIVDEVHNMSGQGTLQSQLLMDLRAITPMLAGMTATLSRGYASSVYNILWAIATEQMKNLGYGGEKGLRAFIDDFGALIGKVEVRSGTYRYREAPKVSPALYSLMLAPVSVYLSMEDLNIPMPSYSEHVRCISPIMADASLNLQQEVKKAARRAMEEIVEFARQRDIPDYAMNYRQSIIQLSLYAADNPAKAYDIRIGVNRRFLKKRPDLLQYLDADGRMLAAHIPPLLPESVPTPKELELFSILEKELDENRRCAVYVYFTDATDIVTRLSGLLSSRFPGKSVGSLPGKIPSSKVDRWLAEHGFDICIIPYSRVAEGSELVQYPTLIFYQFFYDPVKIRQARRRSWRAVVQKHDCRVYFLALGGMQEEALYLVMRKIAASITAEGGVVKEDEMASGALDDIELRLLNSLVEDAEEAIERDYPTTHVPRGRKRPWTQWEGYYINLIKHHNPVALEYIDPEAWEEVGSPKQVVAICPDRSVPIPPPCNILDTSEGGERHDRETLSLFSKQRVALVRRGRHIREVPLEKVEAEQDTVVGYQPLLF